MGSSNLDAARATARENHQADRETQPKQTAPPLRNDTSKKARVAVATSQLNPSGKENISKKAIEESATGSESKS